MRHYLLYRNDQYYIKHGLKCNFATATLLVGLQPLTSLVCSSEDLATKLLILEAARHYESRILGYEYKPLIRNLTRNEKSRNNNSPGL